MNKYKLGVATIVGVSLLSFGSMVTFAKTNTSQQIAKAKARVDKRVTREVNQLNKLEHRINKNTKLSSSAKMQIISLANKEISDLQSFKSKIDSDTTLASIKTDEKSFRATLKTDNQNLRNALKTAKRK